MNSSVNEYQYKNPLYTCTCALILASSMVMVIYHHFVNTVYPFFFFFFCSQSEEVVQLPSAPSSGNVDLIEYENPADLIKALLEQLGGSASINKICKVIIVGSFSLWL